MATPARVEYRTRYRDRGCGCGCGGFFFVLTVGIVLALLNFAISIGVSVGIPFTSANLTVAGAVGNKDKVVEVLPNYTQGRVASSNDFINNTTTMTIWRAEGIAIGIVGQQQGAPAIDLHLELR